jgi:putative salt-induced outer membrane protein
MSKTLQDIMRNLGMKLTALTATTAAFVALAALPSFAETTVFANQTSTSDAVDDLQDDIQDEFDEIAESREFGGTGRATLGWKGSVSASINATSGNTETSDATIGARFSHSDGLNGHGINLSYNRSEDDGDTSADSLSAAYEYTRNFGSDLYGFAQISTDYDAFGTYENDTFVGVGVGYRLINTVHTAWNVQAGPGWRFLETSDDVETDEAALSVGSNYYRELRNGMVLTNDTDILYSESDTSVSNDLGLSVALTGPLALRTSLLTEYHTDPAAGDASTDNSLNLSLVYSFK